MPIRRGQNVRKLSDSERTHDIAVNPSVGGGEPRLQSEPQPNPNPTSEENHIQQMVNQLIEALRGVSLVQPQPVTHHTPDFKDFKSIGTPESGGTTETINTQAWTKEIEKFFSVMGVEENQKTMFTTYMINKMAILQFETFSQILEKAIIAGGGSEALHKFNQEKQQDMVKNDGGNNIEEGSSVERKSFKRKWNEVNNRGMAIGRGSNHNNNNIHRGKQKQGRNCPKCGKSHKGVCLIGKNVCFKCKQSGHVKQHCPENSRKNCYHCRGRGHIAKFCPQTMRGETGVNRRGNDNPTNLPTVVPLLMDKPTVRTYGTSPPINAIAPHNLESGIPSLNNVPI